MKSIKQKAALLLAVLMLVTLAAVAAPTAVAQTEPTRAHGCPQWINLYQAETDFSFRGVDFYSMVAGIGYTVYVDIYDPATTPHSPSTTQWTGFAGDGWFGGSRWNVPPAQGRLTNRGLRVTGTTSGSRQWQRVHMGGTINVSAGEIVAITTILSGTRPYAMGYMRADDMMAMFPAGIFSFMHSSCNGGQFRGAESTYGTINAGALRPADIIGVVEEPTHISTIQERGVMVEIGTDVEIYPAGQDVNARIRVLNTNNFTVRNVSVATTTPSQLNLASGTLQTAEAADLAFEDMIELRAQLRAPIVPTAATAPSPPTGDGANPVLWFTLLGVAVAGVFASVFLFAKKGKKATSVLSLLVCVGILSVGFASPVIADAEMEHITIETETFEEYLNLEHTIIYNGIEMTFNVVVEFEAYAEEELEDESGELIVAPELGVPDEDFDSNGDFEGLTEYDLAELEEFLGDLNGDLAEEEFSDDDFYFEDDFEGIFEAIE